MKKKLFLPVVVGIVLASISYQSTLLSDRGGMMGKQMMRGGMMGRQTTACPGCPAYRTSQQPFSCPGCPAYRTDHQQFDCPGCKLQPQRFKFKKKNKIKRLENKIKELEKKIEQLSSK